MISKNLSLSNIDEVLVSFPCENYSACIGNFDGVHLGHQKLIKNALLNAKFDLILITFSDNLGNYNVANKHKEILTNKITKEIQFSKLGVERIIYLNLNEELLNLSHENFVKLILIKLKIKELFVGEDFKFGFKGLGNVEYLKQFFDVNSMPILCCDNLKISTSNILKFIKNGDVLSANKFLGRFYEIMGTVIEGNHIGRTIGFPTANIELSDDFSLPKNGVYSCVCYISGIPHKAICNVGIHPTVSELKKSIIEVHIIDFNKEIYGNRIYVNFIEMIREERKFDSLEMLKSQIEEDLLINKKIFSKILNK